MATKWMRNIAATVLVGFIAQGAPRAQQPAPSFEETVAWIQSKWALLGGTYFITPDMTNTVSYDSFSMDACTMRFRASFRRASARDKDDPGKAYRTTWITEAVDLTEISEVRLKDNSVYLISPIESIKAHKEAAWKDGSPVDSVGIGDYMQSQTDLDFFPQTADNADLMPRMQKALQNAVTICKAKGRRKSEPF